MCVCVNILLACPSSMLNKDITTLQIPYVRERDGGEKGVLRMKITFLFLLRFVRWDLGLGTMDHGIASCTREEEEEENI